MTVSYYFAYGSNMNPERVADRGLRVGQPLAGVIQGYSLRFDKVSAKHPDAAHANIVFDQAGMVEGVLYPLASADEILKMDRFENAPINYGRDVVMVEAPAGNVAAWTYFANAHARRPGLRPPRAYLAHLLAGRQFLSAEYFARLEEHPCID